MTIEQATVGKHFIIGCDPGPVCSAIVLVRRTPDGEGGFVTDIKKANYLENRLLASRVPWVQASPDDGGLSTSDGWPTFLAYEKCGARFLGGGKSAMIGESTFETAAMGGEIRRAFRPFVSGVYALVSSDWRHALTGRGNAKTPLVYHEICHRFFEPAGGGSDPYKGTSKEPGPLWGLHEAGKGGNMEHLKDALGCALGLTLVRFRSGKDPEMYRRV